MSNPVGKRISKKAVQKIVQHYRDTGGWDDGQTKSVWFSKDDFAKILDMIKNLGGDGMNIYLGRYAGDDGTVMDNHKNRITVAFVPTRNKTDIFDVEGSTGLVIALDNGGGDGSDDGDDGFNHGELKP